MSDFTRRQAARVFGGAAAGLLMPFDARRADAYSRYSGYGRKAAGHWAGNVANVRCCSSGTERKPLTEVLEVFRKLGGRLIDSSPMYGRAEEVIGDLIAKDRDSFFLATKVWTRGKENGIESMERSFKRLQTSRIDLMQVHNLVDVETQLATMRDWKAQGRIRYLGVTHYEASALPELEHVVEREKLDFVQINDSIMESEAERRLLPLAEERGLAVIANRPFGGGDLFSRVHGKALPDLARECDCSSWAQFFLKWIVANPAVTCAIPATNNARHLEDDMAAGSGRLPDAKMRRQMQEYVSKL